ncbi:MAG TPA: ATP-binding protein [Paracoccus sp. (in: a-proteobacteria)]|nr:ATP-binding protein [Paracoccus sp. (in: a-proteobacteria)]
MNHGDLQRFCEAVPVAMLVVDRRTRIVAANAAAAELFGPDLNDRPFVTAMRQPGVNAALDWVLEPDRHPAPPPDPDLQSRRPDCARLAVVLNARGRDLDSVVTVSPLRVGDGRGAAVFIEDSTGIQKAEQMRRDFVANVSHELRTPLTALIGFIETLRGAARNDPAARERFLDTMQREAGRMNRLVADLLSLSRVEGNERRRPAEDIDLSALIANAVTALAPTTAVAGVRIRVMGADRSVRLQGDADQIVQIFHNLIENAVKYGRQPGEVRVTLSHVAHEPVLRGPGWAVEVADDGEGVEALHLPRLTERFYRVDPHRSREKGGTGLGLAIVKHIVNRHRGRLRIESVKGQGSRFTVILPERQDRR